MGNVYDGSRGAEVWSEWDNRIQVALAHSVDVIADATNLPYRHRATLRSLADQYKADTHAIVLTNIAQAVNRNMQRRGEKQGDQRVPDHAMMGFVSLYERMLRDIQTESYTSVTYVEKT